MRTGKFFDKPWKIQRTYVENFYKTSTQYEKFSKTSENFTKLYEAC